MNERPREKLLRQGPAKLRDVELVSILLCSGNVEHDVRQLAGKVLKILDAEFTNIEAKSLLQIRGIGPAKACTLLAAVEFARRRFKPINVRISNAKEAFRCIAHLADRQENFISLTINGAGELLHTRTITRGLLTQTLVHPREVFADAITDRAASLIIAHNHPSGKLEPSADDLRTTNLLAEAGQLLGIELSDHLIFNRMDFYSLREHGYL